MLCLMIMEVLFWVGLVIDCINRCLWKSFMFIFMDKVFLK